MTCEERLRIARQLIAKLYYEHPWENSGRSGVSLLRADDGRGANDDEKALWDVLTGGTSSEGSNG
jgi:hypothetical protein